jgi:hypothetical protein
MKQENVRHPWKTLKNINNNLNNQQIHLNTQASFLCRPYKQMPTDAQAWIVTAANAALQTENFPK